MILSGHSLGSKTIRKVLPRVAASTSAPLNVHNTYVGKNGNHLINQYTSRAHPQPIPQYSIVDGIRIVLEQAELRANRRIQRWELNKEKRRKGLEKKGLEVKEEGPYKNQDETISLALNLNLDPRKPNQSLRGQMPLPHGTGRSTRLAIFSLSPSVLATAMEEGAVLAGGEDLIDGILEGNHLDEFDRVIATPDIMPMLGKKCARILGPRGLMPNPKMGNIVNENDVASKIKEQLAGMVPYRTDKGGIIHAPIGKYSFGQEKLEQNIRAFLEGIAEVEPELDKKAKKQRVGGKGGKFMLKVHLNATQGKAIKVDLKTSDPNSMLFMTNGVLG